jgi:hypothetical protein
MNFIKRAWLTYRQLKIWLQILIVLILLGLLGAITGGGSSTGSDSINSSNPTKTESSTSAPVPTTPAVSDAEFQNALSRMSIKKDEVRNTKYYRDKTSPKYVNQNGFDLYVGGTTNETPYLYLEIQYEGSDWLFIQSYLFNVDGETFEITPDYGVIKTDNDTNVWEWYNEPATFDNVQMIQKIINSKKTIMRLNGRQYYKDVIISPAQKTALKNVLTVYQGLGGDLNSL